MTDQGYRVDDLIIDCRRRRVMRGDVEIPLSALSFDLMLALARAAPDVLSFDDLVQAVWTGLVVTPEAITQRIKVLRSALGDDAQAPRYIQGARGRGYRMLASVVPLGESLPAPLAPHNERPTVPDMPPRGPHWRPILLAVGAALVLVAIGVVGSGGLRQSLRSDRPVAIPARTVAVMPFANLSGSPEYEYVGDGLTEELINRLAGVPRLQVVARTSAFHFKQNPERVQAIGNTLGVRHLLEGSVRKSGNTLRVTAQLVDTRTGYHVWSKTFERSFSDIFAIQDEIALAVVEKLEITLRDEARAALVRHSTTNAEALDLYLRARHFYQSFHLDRIDKAIGYYEAALRLDPDFAAAYVGLADALLSRIQIAEIRVEDADTARIIALLRKAISLDPDMGDAHAVLSAMLGMQYDLAGAAREQRLAEALSPNSEYVLLSSAQFYAFYGSPVEKALEYAQRGRTRDPLNPWAAMQVPIALLHANRFEAALTETDLVIELDPEFWVAHWVRAFILDALARYEESLASARRAVELNDYTETQSSLALAYARLGRRQEAEAIVERLADSGRGKYWPPTLQALVRLALNQKEEALAALERAYDERDWWLPTSLHIAAFVPLHDEPRFQRLVALLHKEQRVRAALLASRDATERQERR